MHKGDVMLHWALEKHETGNDMVWLAQVNIKCRSLQSATLWSQP